LAFDIAQLAKPLSECCEEVWAGGGEARLNVPDLGDPHRRLRACRERPCGGRTADERDELAPPHGLPQGQWITDNYSRVRAVHRSKSGRTMTGSGQTRPIDTPHAVAPCPLRPESDRRRSKCDPSLCAIRVVMRRSKLHRHAGSGRLQSHETRIAGQILCPISKIVRRYKYHRKRDAHSMFYSNAESYVACSRKERRHLRRAGLCGQM
jgi:hypothetical protein